ncbi:DUF3221 domain-containing protein [Paenibacillus sp. MMS18-CY102]|uniref:DUF3221 domain-containing protein n=1 Tax=Paenibacillus sp. MMS18-CY102 TaxID=2682849 RepID=UPI0013653A06|nr:DUF3221 domain-containing protein [Paenibacillus sp. MMS18-CY102]MWC30741.1 DUF3221 domain-containing protein [Paenibacillus sp. MMS18-CY102]
MRKIIKLTALALLLAGCSNATSQGEQQVKVETNAAINNWDYNNGFVIAKSSGNKVIIVRDKVANLHAPLQDIMSEASPYILELTVVDQAEYERVRVGDQVKITIPGTVNFSVPATAQGHVIRTAE